MPQNITELEREALDALHYKVIPKIMDICKELNYSVSITKKIDGGYYSINYCEINQYNKIKSWESVETKTNYYFFKSTSEKKMYVSYNNVYEFFEKTSNVINLFYFLEGALNKLDEIEEYKKKILDYIYKGQKIEVGLKRKVLVEKYN